MTEVIQVAREMRVLLQFTAFEMECNDHLTITDGDGTTLLPQSCGSTVPSVIKSTSNLVKLSFKTNRWISGMGWSANWTAITPG